MKFAYIQTRDRFCRLGSIEEMTNNFLHFSINRGGLAAFVLALWMLLVGFAFLGCGVDHAPGVNEDVDGDESPNGDESTVEGVSCERSTDCAEGEVCDPSTLTCKVTNCETDADCPSEWTCYQGSLCVPKRCKNTEYDCDSGTYCSNGYCLNTPTCRQIADLRVLETVPITQSGQVLSLRAVAYDAHGWPVPSPPLHWESYDEAVFSINSGSGRGTGGSETGTTTVRVRTDYTDETCIGSELSATLTVRNFAALKSGFRLVLVDRFTWAPIADATVVLGERTLKSGATPADLGMVLLEDSSDEPLTLHVFHEKYQYLSLVNIHQHDVLLPMTPFAGKNKVSGIQGELDFARFSDSEDDISLGLAGLSMVDSLLANPLDLLFRGKVLSGFSPQADTDEVSTVPANLVFDFDAPGQVDKPRFHAVGEVQASSAWAIGGKLTAADMALLGEELLTEGSLTAGVFFAMALGASGSFKHARMEDLSLDSLSLVPDDGLFLESPFNVPDINGNGSLTDLIPPYTQFKDISVPLALKEPMETALTVGTNRPANWFSDQLVGRLAVVFGETDQGQWVPLGMGANFDEELRGEGLVPEGYMEVPLTMTPPYGPMKNAVTLAALAVPLSSLSADSKPSGFSVVLRRLDWFEEGLGVDTISLKPFLNFLSIAAIVAAERKVNVYLDPEIDLHQVILHKEGRRWEIFFNESQKKADVEAISLVLPVPPYDDPLGWDMTAQAVDLAGTTTLDDLLCFSGSLLHELDLVTERFSVFATESGEAKTRGE